jgi:hypothetical protein
MQFFVFLFDVVCFALLAVTTTAEAAAVVSPRALFHPLQNLAFFILRVY